MKIFNQDCIKGAKEHIEDKSIDLMICDPPFGIDEATFDKHYKRQKNNVFEGYVEAPKGDYQEWTKSWLIEAKRVLKDNGSMYLVSGWSNLREVLNACHEVGFNIVNHIIWKFNFSVWTTTKYISSHYHILYMGKPKAKLKFNGACNYGCQEKDEDGKSLQNTDRQDVWIINKEYHPGEQKNKNKLPNDLIQKMVQYSSDENDVVCDFFMGNFTTAYVAYGLGRKVIGFELNKESFDYHYGILKSVEFGNLLPKLRKVVNESPVNQGKTITEQDIKAILKDYHNWLEDGKTKKEINLGLQKKYGRGKFAIINILDKYLPTKQKSPA